MSLISLLLKFQTWDKAGRKIANTSFEAPGQSDWSRAMLIANQIFGEGKIQITPELISSFPTHIRQEIVRNMKQPLLKIDPELTKGRLFLAWCQMTGNRYTMELLRKQAEREEDIPLGLSTMRTYSRGVIPSGPGSKRRSGGETKGTTQTKYIPEIHERDGYKFCTYCNVTKGNNPIGHTVFECKDPRCTRSKIPMELRFMICEADQPVRGGSVVRGQGGRGRPVSRFRGTDRGGHFRGHKGRGRYRLINHINTQENTSSITSASEDESASSSMSPHSRIARFINRIRNTGNFPNRKQTNAINHDQSIADFGNPVNNSPTAQQFLLNFLQFHKPSSDINSIFGINSTISKNHIRSQRSPFLRLEILINNIKMIAIIDSAAFCSVITEDLANKCNMSINRDDTIEFLPANNVSSKSLGTANDNQSSSPSNFEEQLTRSGCEIKLDDDNNKLKLTSLLGSFSDVFSDTPNRKGIDCNPLTIPFRDENAMVHKPARTFNPSKMEIANKIFDKLIEMGYAVESNYIFSSPIVLVIYPDGKKPRLTGDFSGKDGVNAHTISVEPNLPRIRDILEFLSRADYFATLDLPKAFWQMNVAEKDIEKTSISIPGRSIMFKRACFGLKNIPAVFQNVMMEIFQIDGVFIYINDIIIVGTTFKEFYKRLQRVLQCARNRRVNIGLRNIQTPYCYFRKHLPGQNYIC
ncbi:hypothetical protein P9112_012357 [Eukaryota sp. TZLM1-RC]